MEANEAFYAALRALRPHDVEFLRGLVAKLKFGLDEGADFEYAVGLRDRLSEAVSPGLFPEESPNQ